MKLKEINIIFRIARTELGILFYSPVAWLILIVFAVQCGITFCDVIWPILKAQSLGIVADDLTNVVFGRGSGVFPAMLEYLYFYVPLLTMGLMSREFSSGSIKLLYSSPITNSQIILGKFLSVMIYCAILLGVILLYVVFCMVTIDRMDGSLVFSNLLGMYLLICAYAAIGLFMSCLTSYQVVTAICTLAFLSFLNFIGGVGLEIPFVQDITYWLALSGRAGSFIIGLIDTENVIYFLVVIAVFVLLSIWRLQSVREKQPLKRRVLKLTGLVVVVVMVGYISSRPAYTWYWDTTDTQKNTVSLITQDLLGQLEGDLKVTTYVNLLEGNYISGLPAAHKEDFERFRPYVRFKRGMELDYVYYYDHADEPYLDELYPGLSDRERAEKICQARNLDTDLFLTPEEIRQEIDLSGEENRFIRLIEWNGEKKTWLRVYNDMFRFHSEVEMAAALKRLLVKPPKLAFLTGHGERNSSDKNETAYSFFSRQLPYRNSLINQGFDVIDLLLSEDGVPEDVDILVIAGVKEAIAESERKMVVDYIDRGGNIFVLCEPGVQGFMNPLVTPLGVEFQEGMLLQRHQRYLPSLIVADITPEAAGKFPGYNYLKRYRYQFVMPGCVGLSLADKGFEVCTVAQVCDTNAWLVDRVCAEDSLKQLNYPGHSEGDCYPVMAALSRKVGDKEQRILVAGDADCISNEELSRGREGLRSGNYTLIAESFRWLAQDEFPIVIPTPVSRDNHLCLQRKDMPWLKFSAMGMLPFILVVMYGMVHYRRKRN